MNGEVCHLYCEKANELLASVCIIQSSTMLAPNLPYNWK